MGALGGAWRRGGALTLGAPSPALALALALETPPPPLLLRLRFFGWLGPVLGAPSASFESASSSSSLPSAKSKPPNGADRSRLLVRCASSPADDGAAAVEAPTSSRLTFFGGLPDAPPTSEHEKCTLR